MFIHRENALKAHQHISYHCSIPREHFKKKNFNTKSDQNIRQDEFFKIFAKTHQIAHFLKICSRGIACPLACVQLLS